MGNRSRFVAVSAAAGAALAAGRWWSRLHRAGDAVFEDAVRPAAPAGEGEFAVGIHAGGHRHVPRTDGDGSGPRALRDHHGRRHGRAMRRPLAGG